VNAAANPDFLEERYEPGLAQSVALAAAVHVLLALVLLFGVRWQNRPPEAVAVELWTPPPPPVIEKVEPPKPQPVVEPTPPPKPEPVIEKPDIAEKAPPKPKPKPEPLKKVEPKPEPPKKVEKARDDPVKRRMEEELRREQLALNMNREKDQIQAQLQREGDARALKSWSDKVRLKVRGNMVLIPDIRGNPEAVFDIVQLPTGEVLSAKLRRSSGQPALDEAIERAILKSSPLPRPDRPELFQRSFELRYRPKDD
jgi:colicin import membrane protein